MLNISLKMDSQMTSFDMTFKILDLLTHPGGSVGWSSAPYTQKNFQVQFLIRVHTQVVGLIPDQMCMGGN